MIIDFHTHVFPDKIAESTISALAGNSGSHPFSDGTVNGLVDAMKKASADVCVSLPVLTKATQFDSVLKFAISVNEVFKDKSKRIISFAGMHPDCDDIDQKMQDIKGAGIKGVKIHPDYQRTYIDDDKYYEILSCAKKYDLIVVTHSGVDDGYKDYPVMCPPERVLKIIDDVKHDKFVLAHFGAHRQWKEVLSDLCGKNVYFDTAFTLNDIDEKLFIDIVNKHGDDKILFATDSPWRDIKEDSLILKSFNLSQETKDKIFYKNALKLLGI